MREGLVRMERKVKPEKRGGGLGWEEGRWPGIRSGGFSLQPVRSCQIQLDPIRSCDSKIAAPGPRPLTLPAHRSFGPSPYRCILG